MGPPAAARSHGMEAGAGGEAVCRLAATYQPGRTRSAGGEDGVQRLADRPSAGAAMPVRHTGSQVEREARGIGRANRVGGSGWIVYRGLNWMI